MNRVAADRALSEEREHADEVYASGLAVLHDTLTEQIVLALPKVFVTEPDEIDERLSLYREHDELEKNQQNGHRVARRVGTLL